MTLAASGTLSLGGATATRSVDLEFNRTSTAMISLNDNLTRALAAKASGQISFSDLYGKQNLASIILFSNNSNYQNVISYNGTTFYGSNDTASPFVVTGMSSATCVAWNGTIFLAAAGNYAWRSTDGTSWTSASTSITPGGLCWDVTHSLFIMTMSTNSNIIFTSPDGITWTQRSITTGVWGNCAAGGGTVVVVGSNIAANVSLISTNGTTYTQYYIGSPAITDVWGNPVWNGSVFCVTSSANYAVWNGSSWTTGALPTSYTDGHRLIWDGTYFILPNDVSPSWPWCRSTNGTTWTTFSPTGTWNYSGVLAYDGTRLWCIGNQTLSYSTDHGSSWTAVSLNNPGFGAFTSILTRRLKNP